MSEEILSNLGRDESEGFGEGDVKGRDRPGLEVAQALFDDRPAELDWVEVRRIGREV